MSSRTFSALLKLLSQHNLKIQALIQTDTPCYC